MGFQGSLASVNLGDLFQTIAMNRQTGTLVVTGDTHSRHIWFESGEIVLCDGANRDGEPIVLDILQRRGQLSQQNRDELQTRLYQTGQPLRDLILASNYVSQHDLDETCQTFLEEQVCEIFEWSEGSFSFIDGDPSDELCVLEIVEAGEVRLQTSHVVMEAMRRVDEWAQIRTIIPNPDELYIVDNDGRSNLRNIESDAEVLKVLRYLDGRHSIPTIAEHVGLPRFDTFAIVANLVINNIARARNAQETLDDALSLRQQGEKAKARNLLEAAASQIDIPDIIRPLAELSLELGDRTRAIELYLGLIERAQDDGNLEQALQDIEVVQSINPDDPDIQLDRAEILIEMNRTADAAEAFIKAAGNYLANRDIKLAIDACHRAKDLQPTSPAPHRYLAQAYLLDNQSENALMEYKSLWHVLLSHHRPRRALDELRTILDQDCKFPRIKEEVMQHAGGSEAVKTSAATRTLLYVLMFLAIVGAALFGVTYYQDQIKSREVQRKATSIRNQFENNPGRLDYSETLSRLMELSGETANIERQQEIESLSSEIRSAFEARGAALADRITADLASLEDPEVSDRIERLRNISMALAELKTRFSETTAGRERTEMLDRAFRERRAAIEVEPRIAAIVRSYEIDLAWDTAISQLHALADNRDIPDAIKDSMIRPLLTRWQADQKSADFFFAKAKQLELTEQSQRARAVYEKAVAAQGDHARSQARAALVQLEVRTMENIRKRMQTAVEQGDVNQTFRLLDGLRELTQAAQSKPVQDALQTVTLPFTVEVDHPLVKLSITDAQARTRTVTAPEGTRGSWRYTLEYPVLEKVTVEGERVGFRADQLIITAADKRLSGLLTLHRGPTWQRRLDGVATTTPVLAGQLLVTCTDDNSLAIVDSGLGTVRPVSLGDGVGRIETPPFVYKQVAHVSHEGRIHAIDINTRRLSWTWPRSDAIDVPGFAVMGLHMQEHELIPGKTLLVTGTGPLRGGLSSQIVSLALENGQIQRYPDTPLDSLITAAPLIHKSYLYMPVATSLRVYDSTSVDANQPLQLFYVFRTRGEIHHQVTPMQVYGRPAVLLSDNSGALIAVDVDPNLSHSKRNLGLWPLDAAPTSRPVADPPRQSAYVSLADIGSVVCVNVGAADAEPIRWRFPSQGRLGRLVGEPAIGRNGIYVCDDRGLLYAIGFHGSERWQVDLGASASTGVLVHEGRLYVGTRGQDLLCFEEGSE